MKNIYLLIFSLISIALFTSGIYVAAYEVFPYNIVKSVKNNFLDVSNEKLVYYENDPASLLNLNDKSLIQKTKDDLIYFFWKNNAMPERLPDQIEFNITDSRYSELQNLESIDKITIKMNHDVNSFSYLFTPTISNNKLILYHQGHGGDFIKGKSSIQFFLDNNYSVLAFSMPLLGMNNQPLFTDSMFGQIKLKSHNHFEFLETESFEPISLFIEPPIIALNYIEKNYTFDSIHMVGISGGGWTTMMVSTLESRIDQSFSVAGSYPIYLRSETKNFGDYEQHNSKLYRIANYLDLYSLASFGENRKFIQIFNENDPCCFNGDLFLSYKNIIIKNVENLGKGYFDIYLDETHNEHKISDYSLEVIINTIENE